MFVPEIIRDGRMIGKRMFHAALSEVAARQIAASYPLKPS
jgi:hypothetical protein